MSVQIIRCFIASPGDTSVEREICEKVIQELNKSLGDLLKFRLETLRWENDSRPGFGAYSQDVINSQLGDDYQLFIGIMHQRFGMATNVAGSGTEEEFNLAYKKLVAKDDIEIMFYFNDAAPKTLSEVNIQELVKVNEFKKKLSDLGGYYWKYVGKSQFEETLRKHLNSFLTKKFGNSNINDEALKKKDKLKILFEERLKKSLRIFDAQPIVWIDPVISTSNQISQNPDENFRNRVPLADLINEPKSTMFHAPPLFGQTSLAHYLVKEAWENDVLWVYLNSESLKPHNIHNAVSHEVDTLGMKVEDVKCIVLDSWDNYQNSAMKKLKNLCEAHPEVPIYVMHRVDESKFLDEAQEDEELCREFNNLFLLALPRNQVRKLVKDYNLQKTIGEEDTVLNKVIADLEVLNIHRTPLNCITLLKASEKQFDESPVNRTGMLEMVLFVLFNTDGIPYYKTKPDLKDCEYILGRFCEKLIKSGKYEFTRNFFIEELKSFCNEKFIDVEVDIVFDILIANNILIKKDLDFGFRATYWILYFAAKRMHNDKPFCDYIFESKKYIAFPEIIEFYTGIDRNREDALSILTKDIAQTCQTVITKVGLTKNINPLELMKWMPTEEQIDMAQREIGDGVIASTLPDELKDQHADTCYNQIKPYNQSIQSFFEEYSVHNLMQNIRAASRALRNSDYVEAETKQTLLKEIMNSWEQMSIVLFALTPVLASKGAARLEGASFQLQGDFGNTFEEKVNMIIQVNATNVVGFFKDDLFSVKMGPLLYQQFHSEKNSHVKHLLALMLIFCRPREWKKNIEEYIISLNKNSFYLYDTVNTLRAKYAYDFTTENELREINYLIRMGLAKHTTGEKKPGIDKISRVPSFEIPKREFKDE